MIVSVLPYFPKWFVEIFSKRYIAGVDLEDAINVSSNLNNEGMEVSLDLLGEFQTRKEKLEFYKAEYLKTIESSYKASLETTFSLKPTMFGLLIDKKICYEHLRDILSRASKYNYMIRIDMEDSTCTDLEIELFKKLHSEFPQHIGLVFQAYLHRTLDDLKNLRSYDKNNSKINIRLCKGIYVESEKIAYKTKKEINKHFIENLEYLFNNNFYAAIATHDKILISAAYEMIKKYNISKNNYEFQMLYGVTPDLRKSIIEAGHKMRVYVPFGKDWFNYSTRRLKENPQLINHIVKSFFIKS